MKLNSLFVENIRNIEKAEFIPDKEITVIAGLNGQGKTNLLESIWLLTGSKSFRGSKDIELVKHNQEYGKITGEIQTKSRESKIEITVSGTLKKAKGRFAKVNGVDYGRAVQTAGIFNAVVFEPGHLHLVKGGPDNRRRFVDAALCQLYPGYIDILRRFNRALTQKNSLLKKYSYTSDADSILDVFDIELQGTGEEITKRRKEYLDSAGSSAENYYAEISGDAEKMKIKFCPCCEPGYLGELLRYSRNRDIRVGYSTSGPQREDFEVSLDDKNARTYASQGQRRSIVLSLKLAEAGQILEATGEHPVMLLDDVLSELDIGRQNYLLSRMEGKQSFITACDDSILKKTGGKVVFMNEGSLV